MSLYYEAAAVLANPDKAGGSLKSRIYKKKDLKSSPAQLVALITEASKWSVVLKDVIEKSGVLAEEKKVRFVYTLRIWKMGIWGDLLMGGSS
jgi:putative methyltransferase